VLPHLNLAVELRLRGVQHRVLPHLNIAVELWLRWGWL
jgi:hypothetical protein